MRPSGTLKSSAHHLWGIPLFSFGRRTGRSQRLKISARTGFSPLSLGYLKGDHLVFKYYGLEFDPCRQCVWTPRQEVVPQDMNARVYPVAERHRFVWVWIGDPILADEKKIPNLHFCSDPPWVFEGSTYHTKCNYVLLVDNLLDLSHET
jgi:vanillate monooxygenase